MPVVDFYIEQANIYNLYKKGYKVNPLIKNKIYNSNDYTYTIINEYADTLGYCHLQSAAKYSPEIMSKVVLLLKKLFPSIYRQIEDIVKITKIE
jgi:hypothetical protein